MESSIRIFAGPAAAQRIERDGLQPDMVEVLAGAAGGPKWLAIGQLHRFLFGTWFAGRQKALHTVGSSIGSWCYAIGAQEDPVAAFDSFERKYLSVQYEDNPPSTDDISTKWAALLTDTLDKPAIERVIQHPFLRPHIITALCRNSSASEQPGPLKRGLAQLALSNLRGRDRLARHLDRVVFGPPQSDANFLPFDDAFTTHYVTLTAANLIGALLGSASVPLLMHGVRDIPGAPDGMYRDGGLIDYHLALNYRPRDGLVLMPHFSTRITPGWLDKMLPWRKPGTETTDNLVMIAPSPALLQRLPHGKIPDRKDFSRCKGDLAALYRDWKTAADECTAMAEEFAELLKTQDFAGRIGRFPSP